MSLPAASSTGTAIVTGASSGIGADLARELVARGHGVTLVARREERLHELAAELGDAVRVEVVVCDLADPHARAALFDEIERRGLIVDMLVNNAGVATMGLVADSTVDDEVAQIRVNVEAVVDLTTRAVLQMVPRGRGAVLNVGSVAAFAPNPGQVGYAASKAFIRLYSEGLRFELAGTGVTVTMLHPGPVRTGFFQAAGVQEEYATAFPEFAWRSSRATAKAGIDALDRSRRSVIAGLPAHLVIKMCQVLPRRVLLPLLAQQHPVLRARRR